MIKEGECMKFAVLGLGRTGQAAVCYLKENGQTVIGWDRNTSKVDIINKTVLRQLELLQDIIKSHVNTV